MILRIQVRENDFAMVVHALRTLEKSEESLLKTAVNNTAKTAQKLLVQRASERYAGKAAGNSRIDKASAAEVTAVVRFSSPIHEIRDFHAAGITVRSPYTKSGNFRTARPRGNVLKGRSRKFENAFAVRFQSGHVAVVSRIPGENADKYRGRAKKTHYEKLRVWYSPSYKTMISSVYEPDEISQILHEEVQKVLAKVLETGG